MDAIDSSESLEKQNKAPLSNESLEEAEEEEQTVFDKNKKEILLKPTFKNVFQAKKRLQAFSSQKQPTSPIVTKFKSTESSGNRNDTSISPTKKLLKAEDNLHARTKAVIEEIELLKKTEPFSPDTMVSNLNHFYFKQLPKQEDKERRSRSKSAEIDAMFKKREKTMRNYRKSDLELDKRSPSPEASKKVLSKPRPEKKEVYPRSWDEAIKNGWDLKKLVKYREKNKSSNLEHEGLSRHLLFETVPLQIKSFYMKTSSGEEKLIPYGYIRQTVCNPKVTYSVNHNAIKDCFSSRLEVLSSTSKSFKPILEEFFSESNKLRSNTNFVANRNRDWFPRFWKVESNECKLLENSIGLSFLQNYLGEEDECDGETEEKDCAISGHTPELRPDCDFDILPKNESSQEKLNQEIPDNHEIDLKESVQNDVGNLDDEMKDLVTKYDKRKQNKKRKKRQKLESAKENADESKTGSKLKKKKEENRRKRLKEKLKNKANKKKVKAKKKKVKTQKNLKESSQEDSEDISHEKMLKKIKKKIADIEIADKVKVDNLDEDKKKYKNNKKLDLNKEEYKIEIDKKNIEEILLEKGIEEHHKDKNFDIEKSKKESHDLRLYLNTKCSKPELKKDLPEIKHRSKEQKRGMPKHEGHTERRSSKSTEKLYSKQHKNIKKEKTNNNVFSILDTHQRISSVLDNNYLPTRSSRVSKLSNAERIKLKNKSIEIDKDDFSFENVHSLQNEELTNSKIKSGGGTPDTEEYHSNWESDDEISPFGKFSKKINSYDSDEEMFRRAKDRKEVPEILEMPLRINHFSRRENSKWDDRSKCNSSNFELDNEIKLLEEERKNLNEQRKRLELEKIKLKELELENNRQQLNEKVKNSDKFELKTNSYEKKKDVVSRESDSFIDSSTPKLEKCAKNVDRKVHSSTPELKKISSFELGEDSYSSTSFISILSSPEITSTKSLTPTVLENEYEQFLKAVTSDVSGSKDSFLIGSGEDDFEIEAKNIVGKLDIKNELVIEQVDLTNDLNELSVAVMGETVLLEDIPMPDTNAIPLPVPSPKIEMFHLSPKLSTTIDKSTVKLEAISEEIVPDEIQLTDDLRKPFGFSTIILSSKKKTLLNHSKLKLDDDSDEENHRKLSMKIIDIEIENKKIVIPEVMHATVKEKHDTIKEKQNEKIKNEISKEEINKAGVDKKVIENSSKKTEVIHKTKTDEKPKSRKRSRTRSPIGRRGKSRDRDSKRRYRDSASPKRRNRERSPIRRCAGSPLRRTNRRSPSGNRSRRDSRQRFRSPKRSASPRNRKSKSPKRSVRHTEISSSNATLSHVEHSPLDGFKKSLADSTISDDLLLQHNMFDPVDSSPLCSFDRNARVESVTFSPKRPSLDDRINQVLGIHNESPKALISSAHRSSGNYFGYPSYEYNQYGQYVQSQGHYNKQGCVVQPQYASSSQFPVSTSTKVVQIGNILQVVPSEEIIPKVTSSKNVTPVQQIVQVGNMLQIVPAVLPPEPPLPPEPDIPSADHSTELEMDLAQKSVERKAEREKRKLERERLRMEKIKKRKEKAKVKHMKLKVRTENIIKKALLLENEGEAEEDTEQEGAEFWPPVPTVISIASSKDPSKSILVTPESRCDDNKTEKRKFVQFADGIRPGEGTSPSGGEELSSPPPMTQGLPKVKKRYRKTKVPKKIKKKKIKVKVVKRRQSEADDSDEFCENLPPPSPPPGSPPPHIFPPRIKAHTINNIPPNYLAQLASLPPPPPQQSPALPLPAARQPLEYQQMYSQSSISLPINHPHDDHYHHHVQTQPPGPGTIIHIEGRPISHGSHLVHIDPHIPMENVLVHHEIPHSDLLHHHLHH